MDETFVYPQVSAAETAEIALALTVLANIIGNARIGGANLARVQIDEILRWAPILTELQKENPADQTILFKGPRSAYNLRPTGAAAARVLLDQSEPVAEQGNMLKALIKAASKAAKMTTTVIGVNNALLTVDLQGYGVGTMQDFNRIQEPGSNLTMYWFHCVARALRSNPQRDEGQEEFVYTQASYVDGAKASKAMTAIGNKWRNAPDDALAAFTEARDIYLKSDVKEGMKKPTNLVWTPIFKAVPIQQGG